MSKKITLPNNDIRIVIAFIFLMIIWGSSFILIKKGLICYSPIEVASLRLSSAMVVLIGFAITHLRKIPTSKYKHLFFSAVVAMGLPGFFFAYAQTPVVGVSSSISGVLNALTPLMTFVVGIIFFNQPFIKGKIIGLLMGFGGSALLILINSKGQLNINAYAFFVLAATMCYGINVNYIKRYLADVPSFQLSTVTVTMIGIAVLPFIFFSDIITKYQVSDNHKQAFWAIVALGILGTAVAQIVFNKMLTYTSALVASSITYFIPIVAVLWGVFDGEVLLFWHYAGMLLIIGGVLMMNKMKS
jgi:drug/metabolite transporter (DMT)-like permease